MNAAGMEPSGEAMPELLDEVDEELEESDVVVGSLVAAAEEFVVDVAGSASSFLSSLTKRK